MGREVPHCKTITVTDFASPDEVHFTKKRPVGERLAAWVLRDIYGK